MIDFKKTFPDFSKTPAIFEKMPQPHYGSVLIPLFLEDFSEGACIVYAAPEVGRRLRDIAPFLGNKRLIMIENYCMPFNPQKLKKNIAELPKNVEWELIEKDFVEVWEDLKDVDMLILDGPPTTFNFDPFSKKFIYIMHDLHQRLTCEFNLARYLPMMGREDESLLLNTYLREHPEIPEYFINFQTCLEMPEWYRTYGPWAWLSGEKQ